MTKPKTKLHIEIETEFKEKLKAKARSLGIPLSSFIKMVLNNSLKGELIIPQ